MALLGSSWRPVAAVLEQRPASPQERADASLWPAADPTRRIFFPGEARGFERAWQMATLRWVAIQVGLPRYFPKYDLPLRKGAFPSPGKVPFWSVGDESFPLLVASNWTAAQLHNDAPLPTRLLPYVVDPYGMPQGDILEQHREDAPFSQFIREELVRLDKRLRDQ